MIIFPAIDLKDGACVRLTKGEFDKVDVFSKNPEETAKKWFSKGAKFLHVVDLDGAKDGEGKNLQAIKSIREAIDIPVQVGGGIRDEAAIKRLLDIGVDRVILGTVAVENRDFLVEMVEKYGDKIAVSVDAKEGKVATRGWIEKTEVDSIDFCKDLESIGVKTVVYTDIARDGMMQGANLEVYKKLNELVAIDIIASGGVSRVEDIVELNKMDVYGAIVGKALYLGSLDLEEINKLVEG